MDSKLEKNIQDRTIGGIRMKKYFAAILILLSLVTHHQYGLAQKPDYEKYGRMAIAVVAAEYPGDEVKEYEYLGREKLSGTNVIDSFRFQVQENQQPFYVIVKVTHDLSSKKLVHLTVESQKR